MRPYDVIIYGAYGYTGKLVTRECQSRELNVLLSGRDRTKLEMLSENSGYAFEACNIDAPRALRELLGKGKIVIHCAGPFQSTARQMVDACLQSGTHYLDITGEFPVFEMLVAVDSAAKQSGILVMPGVGFDVVPSDCLALHLKNKLPSATRLQLAFTMSKGGMSRGTSRTMIEGLGYGSMIRKNGRLTPVPLGEKTMEVDFGEFKKRTMCIPWGDIATAWRSTGIPNIEVYSAVPSSMLRLAKIANYFNWLMRKQWVKNYLKKKIDAKPAGPDDEKLNTGKSYLWGRALDTEGRAVEARLKTVSGYLLTARTATTIAQKLLSTSIRTGYYTPAQYFGENLILEAQGSEWS
jgi:short subunit dehydrogenase-like uncharacterized protein